MKRKKFFTDDDLIFIMVVMFMLSIFGPSLGRSKNIMRVYECEEAQLVESEEEQVQKKQEQVQKKQEQVQKKQKQKKQKQKKQKQERLVTVTRYNPVLKQCDEDPLITADNSEIDLKKLKANKLRWVAVSRDLLLGEFSYGDTIKLTCRDDPSINGKYTIHDCMNKRWKNRVDILTHIESDHGRGKWEDVKIIREGN